MYRNSYNRRLTKAVKTYLVHCDRGHVDKALLALDEVNDRAEEVLKYTRERMDTKAKREMFKNVSQSKAKSLEESTSDSEEPSKDAKRVGRPRSKVQSEA